MRLFAVLLLCLAAVAFGADIARRSHGLSRIQATGGGGGTCAKESKDVNTCAKSLNKEPEDKDAVSYAKNQCLCFNRGRCASGKCVCMRSYQGTGQWCELDTDKPAKEKDVPDRGNNLNSRIKLGWEIEFPSNSINCAINNAGTLEQCQLTYKQKVDSKFEWDLTTDNSNNGAKPPPAVLTAIGLAPNYDTSGAEFPHTYGLEVKPSNPIVLANLKAAIINLAKLYDEMRTKDANGNNLPNVWMFDTPAPVTSYGFTWSDHSEVYTENGRVTRRVTRDGVAVPKKKYTSDAWKWGQLDYNTVYDKQTKNLRKFQNSRWWIDVGKGFAPSQNPPQITMGFIVSEFNPEKNDFLKHAMSSTNPSRIEGSKAHTLYQDLQQVDFGYGNEPNKIVRTWAQFVIYLAKRFQKDGIVAKQGFDPLFKADICVLTRHILNDLVDSSKKTQDVIATELISKLTPVLKLYGDDGAVKTEIQDRILKLAQENKSCRVAPGDTTVFPVEDLGNKDYIVVMEMRNPQGACVELVKYANLNLNKNRDDLDSKSLALFNKCWKDLQ